GMLHAVAKRGGAFLAKPLVADLGDLVNQVDVELDRQAGAEGEPSPHAVRIGIDRHVEIAAELGEFLDIPGGRAPSRAVDAGDKGDILAARQGAVEGAAKAERKRYPSVAAYRAAIGHLRAG